MDRYRIPFPDSGQGFMRDVDNFCLRILRDIEGDSRGDRSFSVQCIGVYTEFNVGKLEDLTIFGLGVDTSNLNASNVVLVLELV